MFFQVRSNPLFRCVDKAQADLVAYRASKRAKGVGACEEERVEPTWVRAQRI